MPSAIRERLEIFRDISGRPWFRVLGLSWFFVGAWDLILSQFVPEKYSRNFPKLYEVVGMTAGWFSLWTWLMVGALLVVAGAVEWAFRHKKRYLELLHQGVVTPGVMSRNRAFELESAPVPSETIGDRDSDWQFDSQMAGEIVARLRGLPEWQDKIIDVTPEYLWDLFQRGRTSMDGSMHTERFINKWMVVCGPFGDVNVRGQVTLVTFASRASMNQVFMYFSEHWRDRLGIIIQDKKIAIVGRIDRVSNNNLELDDCALVQ